MVPVPIAVRTSHSTRLVHILFYIGSQYVPQHIRRTFGASLAKRHEEDLSRDSPKFIAFACTMPILVLLSGLFSGLTLGYMSLDETQLNVLSISGTPKQRRYAAKIMPVRKNGHLLLVTLLLANMIVNETLPVIADPVLGGGVQGVVVATALIVIFAEIIPQSLFTRYGLYLGAKMAGFTRFLIYALGIISWPVAKFLEFVLGSHHGIIYRRVELKELIAMHSSQGMHGGDLKTDTVTIIGATLDLQEKVVEQAMTPIENVFMLSIDSKLDYNLLKQIWHTGHSRVPVYEEVEVPLRAVQGPVESQHYEKKDQRTVKVKKIIGILLVKQCVLLDPKDATPLRKLPLNKVPFVPNNEPLLGILDKFQEGRSHMAIVSRFSVEKAASVKQAVKRGLTHRLRARVRKDNESDSSDELENHFDTNGKKGRRSKFMSALRLRDSKDNMETTDATIDTNIPMITINDNVAEEPVPNPNHVAASKEHGTKGKDEGKNNKIVGLQIPKIASGMTSMSMLEQSTPDDAVLTKQGAAEFLQGWDPAVMPLGIITLEDVLEELIGEEIYDEFDTQGARGDPYHVPPNNVQEMKEDLSSGGFSTHSPFGPQVEIGTRSEQGHGKVTGLKTLGFFRPRSAPPLALDMQASSNEEVKGGAHDSARYSGDIGNDGGPTILMPSPVKTTLGGTAPSAVLEQYNSLPSMDTGTSGISGTLVGGDTLPVVGVVGTGHGTLHTPTTDNTQPTSSLHIATPPSSTNVSTVGKKVSPPVPTLEAILLDRKRRLAAQSSGSLPASNARTPHSNQGIVAAPAAILPSAPTSASASRPPSRGGGGSGGKGTKFKSSPLGSSGEGPERLGPSPLVSEDQEAELREEGQKKDG